MGVDEIAKILKNNSPEYISTGIIIELSKCNEASVKKNLQVLNKRNEIEYKIIWRIKGWKKYYRIKEEK